MVMESTPKQDRHRPHAGNLLVQTLFEAIAIPFRFLLGSYYA
jgi:hypothetical protein